MSKQNEKSGVQIVTVDEHREGQRLDNFLSARLSGVPRSAVYRLIRTGQVRINGKRCKPLNRLRKGDEVRIPPVRTQQRGEFQVPPAALERVRQAIIHQDDQLLIIDKPAGMAVHSGSGLAWGVIDALRQLQPDRYLELVHRLDRETSGCLVLAGNGRVLNTLSTAFRENRVMKHYLCLMNGVLPEAVVTVDLPLKKIQAGDQWQVIVSDEGRPAQTRFHLLESFGSSCFVRAELLTGRTHQIRAHARHLGLPLAGDDRYAGRDSVARWRKRGLKRLFLHASQVGFDLPEGEFRTFEAPLPASLRQVIDGLER